MGLTILAFGMVKDIFRDSSIQCCIPEGSTVKDLKALLEIQYPGLKELASYMVAVNNEYATMSDILHLDDEVAIIPPVSGG
jgi:molybdopterin converting factor subunit 1